MALGFIPANRFTQRFEGPRFWVPIGRRARRAFDRTEEITSYLRGGASASAVAERLGCHIRTVWQHKAKMRRALAMPEGWMVGRDGQKLTDPNQRIEGFLLPIGAPKGYGLSVAIGLLAGLLNGAAFGSEVVDFTDDTTSPSKTGQFVATIDIAAFGDPGDFAGNAARVFAELRASPPLPGHDPVRIPGDGRSQARAQRLEQRLELHPALRRELAAIAAELGVAALA